MSTLDPIDRDDEEDSAFIDPVTRMFALERDTQQFSVSAVMNLGTIAVALFGVSPKEIERCLEIQTKNKRRLGEILVARGVLTEKQVQVCLEVLRKREGTFLSHAFLTPLKTAWWGRYLQLWLESLFGVLITFYLTYGLLGLEESALVSLFLASITVTTRVQRLIDKDDVKQQIAAVLVTFLGLLTAFYSVALALDADVTRETFSFFMQFAQLDETDTMYTRSLGEFLPLLTHNITVLSAVFVLSFVYRAYGAILILGWNAAIWGLVYALLTTQSISTIDISVFSHLMLWLAALTPHVILEATAYAVCALGAIQVSRGILWSHLRNGGNVIVARQGAIYALASLVLVILGAVFEAYWVPSVLQLG